MMRASALPGKEPNCPCCAGTPYNLVPLRLTDNQRRLRSLGSAIGAPRGGSGGELCAAPAASSGKQIWGNEVDYEPVLLTHNEGPDAEPTSPMTKVHAGPDVPWSYASIRGDVRLAFHPIRLAAAPARRPFHTAAPALPEQLPDALVLRALGVDRARHRHRRARATPLTPRPTRSCAGPLIALDARVPWP
eukprot:COSAG04_NODE_4342_length_2156_cov_9.708984_2_plen_190_part_00